MPKPSLAFSAALALSFLLSSCSSVRETTVSPYQIIDTHIDLPERLHGKWEDVSLRTPDGEFDYPRAVQGGLSAAFMAIYVPPSLEGTGHAKMYADTLIDLVENLARQHPDKFALVYSPREVRELAGKGRILLPMGMENGSPIEGDLKNLAYFYKRGIRYITLAHAKANHMCDAAFDTARPWNGLSPFGVTVVAEMNRLGIMVDVSHLTDSATAQILRISRAPVIASHSACRVFTPGWERNMSDELIRALGANGGVLQFNFGSSFLRMDVRQSNSAENAALRTFTSAHKVSHNSPEAEAFLQDYRRTHPPLFAGIDDLIRHIDHAVGLIGVDHVGLGSDFEGLDDELPVGLKDVSMYPNLIAALADHGYSREDIAKICSGNILRVWTEVEQVAAALNRK